DPVAIIVIAVIVVGVRIVVVIVVVVMRLDDVDGVIVVRFRRRPAASQRLGVRIDGRFLGGLGGGFLVEEGLPVGHRDLIVIGVDFVEGQEAVAVAAVFNEGSLQGRLNACHFGEINVSPQQLAGGGFEIELLYPA